MNPQANFPGSNHHYKAFEGNEECPPYQALSVLITGEGRESMTSSLWNFSMAELMEMVLTGGNAWMNISGKGMPPASISAFHPNYDQAQIDKQIEMNDRLAGMFLVMAKRIECIREGKHPIADLEYENQELLALAQCYLSPGEEASYYPFISAESMESIEKIKAMDYISRLINAAQCIVAEIDRYRLEIQETGPHESKTE